MMCKKSRLKHQIKRDSDYFATDNSMIAGYFIAY